MTVMMAASACWLSKVAACTHTQQTRYTPLTTRTPQPPRAATMHRLLLHAALTMTPWRLHALEMVQMPSDFKVGGQSGFCRHHTRVRSVTRQGRAGNTVDAWRTLSALLRTRSAETQA